MIIWKMSLVLGHWDLPEWLFKAYGCRIYSIDCRICGETTIIDEMQHIAVLLTTNRFAMYAFIKDCCKISRRVFYVFLKAFPRYGAPYDIGVEFFCCKSHDKDPSTLIKSATQGK